MLIKLIKIISKINQKIRTKTIKKYIMIPKNIFTLLIKKIIKKALKIIIIAKKIAMRV
jgi:hypothetical protein